MTQEELADDVRWEEPSKASEEKTRGAQAEALPTLAKRRYLSSTYLHICGAFNFINHIFMCSHSTLIKNIAKKPKKTAKSSNSKSSSSIEDIMGILDKRSYNRDFNDVEAVDKENSLQYNSQPSVQHDAMEANEDADALSVTATLSGNTVATVEHDLAAPVNLVDPPAREGIKMVF